MIVLKYWKQLLATAVLIVCAVAVLDYGQQQYVRGYNAAIAEVQAAAEKQQAKIDTQAEQYENQKAENLEKEKVRYVEIQKIIRQPVYRNVCIDDDGLRTINEAVAER